MKLIWLLFMFLPGLVVATFCYMQFFPPPYSNDGNNSISLVLYASSMSKVAYILISPRFRLCKYILPQLNLGMISETLLCWGYTKTFINYYTIVLASFSGCCFLLRLDSSIWLLTYKNVPSHFLYVIRSRLFLTTNLCT